MGEKCVIRLVFSIKNIAEHVGDRTGSRCIFCKHYWQPFSGSGMLLDGVIAELSRFWHRSEEAMQQVSVQLQRHYILVGDQGALNVIT